MYFCEMFPQEVFEKMSHLPLHRQLCDQLLQYFYSLQEVDAAFLSGSGATGNMDHFSDLDLGFVCSSEEAKEKIWEQRFDWKLPSWFHRMDADHIKSHFIIYLFEPHIHVDIAFYTNKNLPTHAGGPFSMAFDKKSSLTNWLRETNKPLPISVDWSQVIHEEERFWTWTHYSWCHTGRGEYYDDASSFGIMRELLQIWHARLNGKNQFITRRLEQRGETDFIQKMKLCFPTPDRASMKIAMLNLIKIHNEQRLQIDQIVAPKWTTTQYTRDKITKLVNEL